MIDSGDARGLWEGRTPPVTALPDRNQGGAETVELGKAPTLLLRASGSSDYSWTVTVDVGVSDERFSDADSPRSGGVVAVLEWGHGAATFRAEVDARQGTQVTIVATSLKVFALIEADSEDPGALQSAQVNAALIWGARPARSYVTRSHRIVVPAADDGRDGTAVALAPPFAESLTVCSSDPDVMSGDDATLDVALLAGPDAADVALLTFSNASGVLERAATENGIRLPGEARAVLLSNSSDAELPLSLVWGLSL